MTSFNEIKESNDKFLNDFGVKFGDTFIPKCVNEDFVTVKNTLTKINSKVNVIEMIDDLIYTYDVLNESRKNNFPNTNYISHGFSNIILLRDSIVDENCICMSTKQYMIGPYHGGSEFSSPTTFVIKKAYEEYSKETDEQKANEILNNVKSLIATIVEYFDPYVVSILLSALFNHYGKNDNPFGEIFSYESMKKYFETLIIHENIEYANKYLNKNNSVGYVFFVRIFCKEDSIFDMADKILDKGLELKEILSLSTKIPFEIYKDEDITKTLINCFLSQANNIFSYKPKAAILKKIRENITSWIKHKDISTRPEMPEFFEFINMGQFVSILYDTGIYVLGNIEDFVNDKEENIKLTEQKINELEKQPKSDSEENDEIDDQIALLKSQLEKLKEEHISYLYMKSSISFLIEECTANEKIARMVFKPETVASMILREPGVDNAMHDTHTCISSLFVKRDFKPLASVPVNPYYIHYYNDDIDQSSNEALYIADIMSACANPFNRSLISTAGIKDMFSLSTTISSIKMNVTQSRNIVKDVFNAYKDVMNDISSLYKQVVDSFKDSEVKFEIEDFDKYAEDLKGVFESDEIDLDILKKIQSKNREIEKEINSFEYDLEISKLFKCLNRLFVYVDWYIDYVDKVENFLGEFRFITNAANGESEECNRSAEISVKENKPLKNFWPITQQYEFKIEEEPIPEDPTDPYRDVKPGDIYHQRYGSRYKASKHCD